MITKASYLKRMSDYSINISKQRCLFVLDYERINN